MKILDKNYEIEIDEDDIKDARLSSVDFVDEKIKKRAFANILGARLAMKFLFSQEIQANNLYSLYTIHNLLQELDIADIYFKDIKIDIRLVFNSGEIFIPKSHFQYNLIPDVYLVFGLADDMSAVEFMGFFEPTSINKKNANQNYYFQEKTGLRNPDELADFLDNLKTEPAAEISEDAVEKAKEWFLSLADNDISPTDKRSFFKQLSNSPTLREKMVEFENFEFISKAVAKSDDILQDSILDIVGTQQVVDKEALTKAEFKEELAQAIGKDAPKKSKVGLDSLIADAEKDTTTSETEKHNNSTGAIIAGGLGVAAAGLALGTVVAANEANTTSAGIALGSEILNQGAKVISAGLDGLNNIIDEHKLENAQEAIDGFDNVIDNAEDNINFDIPDNEAFQFDDLGEIPTEKLEKLEELENLEKLEPLEEPFENLKLEELDELNELEEEEVLAEISASEDETSEVLNLDDFDFKILDDASEQSSETEDESTADEEFISFNNTENETDNDKESKVFNEFKDLEDLEEESETTTEQEDDNSLEVEDDTDDLMSKVDEFLESADLTEEQRNLLEKELTVEEESETTDEPIENTEELSFIEKEDPEAETEQEADSSLKVLFADEMAETWKNDVTAQPYITPAGKINWSALSQNKKMVIAASLSGVILTSMIIGSVALNHKNAATANNVPAPIAADATSAAKSPQDQAGADLTSMNANDSQPIDQLAQPAGETAKAQPQASAPRDMGQAVSDAFLSEPVNANISKVAWEVPEDLAYNDSFRQYLQVAGKNLKLNLQNNLLLATEMAYTNKVVVDLEINKSGAIQASNIVASSGSKQIDKIVLQSIKETLKYLKMPSSEVQGQSVVATLIINF